MESSQSRAQGVGTRTVRGMAWAYGSYVGGRVLVLVATAVLARLLTPEDFGLVALALIFTGLIETVKDLGVNQALVVADEEDVLDRAQTAWSVSVLLGLGLSLLALAVAPLAADFFHESELTAMVPALGLNLLLRALGATHYALAQRRIDFRTRTAAEFVDVVVRGSTGIALALAGAGAWSLVVGYLVGTIGMNVTLWRLVPWRPALRPRLRHARSLVRFGGTLTAVDVTAAAIANVDNFAIGRVLGAASLGLYTLAWRLPDLVIRNLSVVAGQVLYPAFATVDRAALGRAFLTSLRYSVMVALPMAVGLAILAEPFVLAAFGERWRGAVEAMQVLSFHAVLSTFGIPAGSAYKATGRGGVLLALAVPRLLLLVASLALFVDEGIVAVAACQAGGSALISTIGTVLASRLLGVRLIRILGAAGPSVAAAAGMGAALLGVNRLIDSPWPAIAAGAVIGAAVYGALLWLLAREDLRRLLEVAFPAGLRREPHATSAGGEAIDARRPDAVP